MSVEFVIESLEAGLSSGFHTLPDSIKSVRLLSCDCLCAHSSAIGLCVVIYCYPVLLACYIYGK